MNSYSALSVDRFAYFPLISVFSGNGVVLQIRVADKVPTQTAWLNEKHRVSHSDF